MKQIVQQQKNGRLEVTDVPAPSLRPEGVLVQTAFSLISAGTERAKVEVAKKSLIGKAMSRPDQVRQVLQTYQQLGFQATYQKVMNRLEALDPIGYSSAGIVLAVGDDVTDIQPGDHVACAGGGYATHTEIAYVPRNLCIRLPAGVGLDEAAYGTLGAIALQGIRQAAPTLGETIGVIGLGLLGLLTVQMLKAAGCRVIGLDLNSTRCQLAQKLGADAATTPTDAGLEALIQQYNPAGLDAVILTAATPSSEPIRQAGQLARDRGRVIIVGDVGLDIPRSPFYEKELEVKLSRSYGPGRYDTQYEEKGVDYPIGYVRWTEGRNIAAFVDLLAQKKVDVQTLTTHRFALAEAESAYDLIQGKTNEPYLGVLLDYGLTLTGQLTLPTLAPIQVNAPGTGAIGLALLGAGNFAQSMLLPHLKNQADIRLRTVVTPSGLTARSAAERAGFELCAAESDTALTDEQVRLVVIASRHDSHASLAAQALRAGKAVFVEKPLALTAAELAEVEAAFAAAPVPFLMLGFNRRFAPLMVQLQEFMRGAGEPLLLHYRVNAGHIARDHWTQDAQIGGGRIIGEGCHFVDVLLHLVGQPVMEVMARGLPDNGRYTRDNVSILLHFADGSVGTVLYAANGDKGVSKERLEVFGGGKTAVLDDYRQLTLSVGGKRSVKKGSPDKGHKDEMAALVTAVRSGQPSPVPFAEAVHVTKVTLAIMESLNSGKPVVIGD
ncbi:MAG: bi-domain-containing oxidoreductase [Ardenticatenaceae bacterium]|nr:bi-domain-containing oxidoreductase [Ardenticatenaceae bacterium]